MKTLKSITACTLLAICIFSYSSCDDCSSVNKGAQFADLLVKDYDVAYNQNTSDNSYYKIAYTVINSILQVECPDEVADASPHQNSLDLLFSEDDKFTNPEKVGSQDVKILTSTAADGTYKFENQIEFTKDGYYVIGYDLDSSNAVEERIENNNAGDVPVAPTGGRTRTFCYDKAQIFRVRNSASNRSSSGEKETYYKTWKITVFN